MTPRTGLQRTQLMGCPVDAVALEQAVGRVERDVRAGRPGRHLSLNATIFNRIKADPRLRAFAEASSLVTADGVAIVFAAALARRPLPERVTGVDLMAALLKRAASQRWTVFLYGASPGVADRLAQHLRSSGVRIVGAVHGHRPAQEDEDIARQIAMTRPDLLFVALGHPRQELFIEHWQERTGARFAMGVGGSFDVLVGDLPRAPLLMRLLGLEWAWRVGLQPTRRLPAFVRSVGTFLGHLLRAGLRRLR